MRVPLIARWPGQIPAGSTCKHPVTAMDLTPTLMNLSQINESTPKDGRDISQWLKGDLDFKIPQKVFFYFWERELQAIRQGPWKLRLSHIDTQSPNPSAIGNGGVRGSIMKVQREQALFDLRKDPGETTDISKSHPKVLQRMIDLVNKGKSITRSK